MIHFTLIIFLRRQFSDCKRIVSNLSLRAGRVSELENGQCFSSAHHRLHGTQRSASRTSLRPLRPTLRWTPVRSARATSGPLAVRPHVAPSAREGDSALTTGPFFHIFLYI